MKKRVISAIVALAIVIPIFIFGDKLNGVLWKGLAAALAALAFKETINLKESHNRYPLYIIISAYALIVLTVLSFGGTTFNGINYIIISLDTLVLLTPTIFDKRYTTKDGLYLLGTVLLLGLFFNLMITVYRVSKWLVLYLFLCAAITDTFAMLVGVLIGKHKLIPTVSPKKSVEGSIAGSLVGTIICSIVYYNLITNEINIVVLVIMTLILTIMGQLGDLFFSKIKRENGIKDFSNLMPGHGGVLDRLDSLTFIVLTYLVVEYLVRVLF